MVSLSTVAQDQSTYKLTLTYTDSAGDAVTHTAVTWTMTDRAGTVINSREDVSISSPSTSNDIILSGDDLRYSDGRWRVVTVEATYNSTGGNGLPLRGECVFSIEDLLNV